MKKLSDERRALIVQGLEDIKREVENSKSRRKVVRAEVTREGVVVLVIEVTQPDERRE